MAPTISNGLFLCSRTLCPKGSGSPLNLVPPRLSQTQILLTKITQICQEIRDIRMNKINNIQTKLPEFSQHHIRTPESSDSYGKGDRDDVYYRNNSSNHPK